MNYVRVVPMAIALAWSTGCLFEDDGTVGSDTPDGGAEADAAVLHFPDAAGPGSGTGTGHMSGTQTGSGTATTTSTDTTTTTSTGTGTSTGTDSGTSTATATETGTATATSTGTGAGIPTGNGLEIIASTTARQSGAIATDGTTVFWVQASPGDSGTSAVGDIMSCPVSGCGAGGPTVFAPGVFFGNFETGSLGQLLVAKGSVYFESATSILDCPVAGCAGAPHVFSTLPTGNPGSVPGAPTTIAADGTNLYWTGTCSGPNNCPNSDPGFTYSCALGATCTSATTIGYSSYGDGVPQIVASGTSLYWADFLTGTVYSLPAAGGTMENPSIVCTVPETGAPNNPGYGGVAVVNGSIYVSAAGLSSGGLSLIFDCALTGSTTPATYVPPVNDGTGTAPGLSNVATDGTDLFWITATVDQGASNFYTVTDVSTCVPGSSCNAGGTSTANIVAGGATLGFAINGGYVYTVSSNGIARTPK